MQKVYTKIESIVGNVVTVRAKDVRLGDLALVGDSYATVIKLDKDLVSLQVFAGARRNQRSGPLPWSTNDGFLLRSPAWTSI